MVKLLAELGIDEGHCGWQAGADFLACHALQAVAEPTLVTGNGLVVASVYDLAWTKAEAILDRSEWKDYVDIAMLLRAGHHLTDVVGFATTISARQVRPRLVLDNAPHRLPCGW